ncbi:MAG: LysR family transcriptional regulator [Gammaproteobacteria bacterium]|jgi:DNA-binding transcriptional LysR family regulator|nr:LysR family transcriptional regulator [Gammaproteobacteria bacterium]
MIKKRLPPLDPLIAFEAAARLLSFTRAAEELHLSQAAISQQIRSLEDSLRVKLFTRSHRAVQLTNEGREYQHTVAAVLTQLAGATMDIQNVEFQQQLVIGCDESFATQWLASRFDLLKQLLPEVALRIIASDDYNVSLGPEVQVAVLHGDGNWPGFHALRLFGEEVFPVCSPDYDHSSADRDWLAWLLQAQLIDLADSHWNWMNWRLWLGGNDIDEPLANRNLQINSYPLVIAAACAGQGVALGWRYLVDDLIERGRLVRPVEASLTTDFGYYLLCRDNLQQNDIVDRFRDWLPRQFGAAVNS